MRSHPLSLVFAALALAISLPALPAHRALGAQEDVSEARPAFKTGDTITFEKITEIKPYLPPEFWSNRDFFFFAGMHMTIGPFFRDYSEAPAYLDATRKFAGAAKLGPQASLTNYTAGRPFLTDQIDCKNDPKAGEKIIWNFDYRWKADDAGTSFHYSYWDRGEELPLFYEGSNRYIQLSHRVEPEYLAPPLNGDMFRGERRKYAFGIDVDAPFDARGIMLITYRYKSSDLPEAQAKNDDTWVYVPTLRRVRRISSAQRTDAVSGTDFTFDDLFSFSGIVPQYKWQCLGEMDLLAPMNSHNPGFPYVTNRSFGPYGLSYATDVWELRHAFKIRFIPNSPDHPYSRKDIYIDKQTYEPLYSFAYDRKGDLWKIIYHNHRWSDDVIPAYKGQSGKKYYPGWEGVPDPRDIMVVSDTVVNVQTGTGNRIEFWDRSGTPLPSKGKVRRYIDIGRLTKGR